MRLLLISNSTNAGERYLDHPKHEIRKFLGGKTINCLFIPYAGVTIGFDDYAGRVRDRFLEIGHEIRSIHEFRNAAKAIEQAEAIVTGGGNTFQLLNLMQTRGILDPVRDRVRSGTPYVGWSAGANMACPTIMTTNDMPIVEPENFCALGLIPFQINPHYTDYNPQNHAGETREMRIQEFIELNKDVYVAGLREGSMFLVEQDKIRLAGPRTVRLFRSGMAPIELGTGDDFSFLMVNEKDS